MRKTNQSMVFDIGSKNIKAVIGTSKNHQIEIYDYEIIPIPEDSVFDGRILHKTKVAESIEGFHRKKGKRKHKIMVSISSSMTILRNFDLPKMEEEELKEAIRYEMEHLLPEPMENYIVDFTVLDEYLKDIEDGDKVPMVKVQTAALPRAIIMTYINTFEKAGLKIDAIDIQCNGIGKLFGGRKKFIKDFQDEETIDKNIGIIDIGHQNTTITIIEFGKVFLYRVIDKGGKDINRIVADTLGIDERAAEEWKSNTRFLDEEFYKDTPLPLKQYLQDLLMEVQRVIDFSISRSTQKTLDRIYLIGGGAKIQNIAHYFQENLRIATILGNNYRNISVNGSETSFSEDLLYLSNILGILLRKE
ncbi:type IV pilus assembly protein PilM [Irregularibacter muris]|uniref:Type IV pilus assembly protein PilM n=1 Tax=Irregularibacter muris TaxID=1796619 RepID=A0AAE3HFA1_9FIRM|nr:type IV pilus assembly protein PilM [Irregularibacter muris]MCR1897979.1 type IV pilus assembly protein PilM [Irregularibacter muris]